MPTIRAVGSDEHHAHSDPDQRLDAVLQRLEREAGDPRRYTQGITPKPRPPPAVHDPQSHLDLRVQRSQLDDYYEPNARKLRQNLRIAKVVEVALASVAAALAAATAVSPTVEAWAAEATTAAGAVTAHIAAERYEFLWIEYARTASELHRLSHRRTDAEGTPLSSAALIAACEQVISVQNQAWMAKWGEEEQEPTKNA